MRSSFSIFTPLYFLPRQAADYLQDLQTRTADNVEDMTAQFSPYFSQVRDNAQAKISTLNDLMRTQAEAARETIEGVAGSVKDRLEETTGGMRSNLETKMEELKDFFQSFGSMFGM